MKTIPCLLAACTAGLLSCAPTAPQDSSSYYYPSANQPAAPAGTSAGGNVPSTAGAAPRGGYSPGSGPTAMPQGQQFMYEHNESGPFGSRSSTGVIQSSGGVQSYQTIGGVPVYPGASVPGHMPGQPYFGGPGAQQPVFVPGVGGAPGYYVHPTIGARIQVRP